ncbi:MAG: hypothetical protein Q4A01_11010 [Coriobacteriales bacterium]|nr:hypothetical protein [Coriobacteriales bacterium]
MPRLEFSDRFATDLAAVTSSRVEEHVMRVLDCLESFGEFGSPQVPESLVRRFGPGIRKVAVRPFELLYTFYPDENVVRVEALVHGKSVQ